MQSRLENGMGKSRDRIWGRISNLIKVRARFDETLLEQLEEILIEGDVGVDTTLLLLEDVRREFVKPGSGSAERVRSVLKERMVALFDDDTIPQARSITEKPIIILVVGVNGTGKTTTIGKLAHRFRKQGKKVLLAGADTFRAAAGEQLEVWGKRVDADVIRQCMGADPASVAYDALNAALARDVDVLMIDTAGRIHTKVNLMEELKKVPRVLKKRIADAPHEILLVIDGTTGQNGLSQARLFTEAVGVTGLVLTKLDGTARGGIVVAIHRALGIPVRWVGLGEAPEDLIPFDAKAFVDGLFG